MKDSPRHSIPFQWLVGLLHKYNVFLFCHVGGGGVLMPNTKREPQEQRCLEHHAASGPNDDGVVHIIMYLTVRSSQKVSFSIGTPKCWARHFLAIPNVEVMSDLLNVHLLTLVEDVKCAKLIPLIFGSPASNLVACFLVCLVTIAYITTVSIAH